MSMRIEFTGDPKGIYPERVKVGDVRWVPRATAVRLIKEGFAILRGPPSDGEGYEVATLQQTEKAIQKAGPPKKGNDRRRDQKGKFRGGR